MQDVITFTSFAGRNSDFKYWFTMNNLFFGHLVLSEHYISESLSKTTLPLKES
ncbi:hypothetical protein LCGC14_2680570 [marine sediment metagenome]|uniref:Uncharacterized protein n=1 Tax=marine sediment metagenome TaxID=412755 RepID=A0A0F8ZLF6_9ZZZZ